MKTTLAVVSGVLILGAVAVYLDRNNFGTVEYQKEVIEKEIEVTPDWASDQEAVEAAQAVIRRKELEAQENALESNLEALTAQYEADKAEIVKELEEVQKELGSY